MHELKVRSLQWAVGGFCTLAGAMLLVAPHQFNELVFFRDSPLRWLLGAAFLSAGFGLLGVWAVRPSRRWVLFVHLLGGASLLVLAFTFARSEIWVAALNYAVLGAGTLFGGLLPGALQTDRDRNPRNLLIQLLGLSALLSGAALALVPEASRAGVYGMERSQSIFFGLAFILSGLYLLAVQVSLRRQAALPGGRGLHVAIQVAIGGLFLIFAATALHPANLWTEVLYYAIFGTILALLPWLDEHMRQLTPDAARTRVALILVLATTIPIIVTVAITSELNERSVRRNALAQQERQAVGLAGNVLDYIRLHRSALLTLAVRSQLWDLPSEDQARVLSSYAAVYPDALSFALFDSEGVQIAGSDGLMDTGRPVPFAELGEQPGLSGNLLLTSGDAPRVLISVPSMAEDERIRGYAVATLSTDRLVATLQGESILGGEEIFLEDSRGNYVSSTEFGSDFAVLSPEQVALMDERIEADERVGSLVVIRDGREHLVSYSVVPGLDWRVITVRPSATALVGIRAGRDLAFLILVVFVSLTALLGLWLAGLLTSPLKGLSKATRELAAGNLSAPLPKSGVREVRELVDSFAEMRTRLQARTRERDRAEAGLRRAHAELEARVQARTADLEEANRNLEAVNQSLRDEVEMRLRVEKALANYARQLKRSNQELQDFAYIASHDLQEPLRKIQAFSERILTAYRDRLDERGQDYLDRMIGAAERMQAMINALLTYSRVTTQAQPMEPVDLNRVVREVVSDLETRVQETGGRILVGDLPEVPADRLQMRQLFQNLISNALKFHRPGIPPVVKVYNVPQADFEEMMDGAGSDCEQRSEDCVHLAVSDNGIGFDEKYLDRIFQPFQRLHGRSVYQGSGIGLAICRKIAERHNGSLEARSRPGEGATFLISLPVQQKDQRQNGEKQTSPVKAEESNQ